MADVIKAGHYTIGTPVRVGHGTERSWRRPDTYHSRYPDLDGCVDSVHVAGSSDMTPVFQGRYDAQCPCCWLNFPHSVAKHEAALLARDQALAKAAGGGWVRDRP